MLTVHAVIPDRMCRTSYSNVININVRELLFVLALLQQTPGHFTLKNAAISGGAGREREKYFNENLRVLSK